MVVIFSLWPISLKTKVAFISGKLNPTTAFMSGKLKMEGNLGKALALEKVMKKMNQRGYHTSARLANFNNGTG